MAVDYAGQPCDYNVLNAIASKHGLALVADACHAWAGAIAGGRSAPWPCSSAFSFHPVKHVATGEGGAVTTNDAESARRMRLFRNHGITSDFRQRAAQGAFAYEMVDLEYNYRISDIQCALGTPQLAKLLGLRRPAAGDRAANDMPSAPMPAVKPLALHGECPTPITCTSSAWNSRALDG